MSTRASFRRLHNCITIPWTRDDRFEESLGIEWTEANGSTFSEITERLKAKDASLQSLKIRATSHSEFQLMEMLMLCKAIMGNTTVRRVDLSNYAPSNESEENLLITSLSSVDNIEHVAYRVADMSVKNAQLLITTLVGLKRLRYLSISKSNDTITPVLSGAIACLEDLETLRWHSCHLTSESAVQALGAAIAGLVSLKHLCVYDMGFHRAPGPLVKSISALVELRHLDISGNRIGPDHGAALAQGLAKLKKLQHIDMHGCDLGDGGVVPLAKAVAELGYLQYLNLYENNIQAAGGVALGEAFGAIGGRLLYLNIGRNEFGKGDDTSGRLALLEGIGKLRSLDYLNLEQICIRNVAKTGAVLGKALTQLGNLQVLILGFNQLGDASTIELSKGIAQLGALEYAHFYRNQIGDAGAQAVAEAIVGLKKLKQVNLEFNRVNDKGCEAIIEAAIRHGGIVALDLNDNQIGLAGAKAVARAVTVLKSLERLFFQTNNYGEEGAQLVADALWNAEEVWLKELWMGWHLLGLLLQDRNPMFAQLIEQNNRGVLSLLRTNKEAAREEKMKKKKDEEEKKQMDESD